MSPADRCAAAASAFVQELSDITSEHKVAECEDPCSQITLGDINKARERLQVDMLHAYKTHAAAFLGQPTTAQYLGHGTRKIYDFVREKLNVPIHRGLEDHPTPQAAVNGHRAGIEATAKKTIGFQVSKIYEAVRNGRLYETIMVITKDLDL